MENTSFETLYDQFIKLVEKGDESKARDFLLANINSFPQDVQDGIILALLQEALADKKNDAELLLNFQKQAVEAMHNLNGAEVMLEKNKKLAEIKESL